MGILRGTTHQSDSRVTTFAGSQRLANALASLAMLQRWKSRVWVPRIIDQILRTGNRLYAEIMRNIEGELHLTDITKIRIDEIDYAPQIDEYSTIGRLQSEEPDVLDLLPALQEFLSDHEACVIVGPLVVSVWYEDGYYYMFDPNERDNQGLAKSEGVACVTWFKSLKDLVDLYFHNVPKNQRRDVFVLNGVEINAYADVADSWNNFKGLDQAKWILRGTFSQNDRKFAKDNRNTQSTPMAAVALAKAKMTDVSYWSRGTVDHVS